MSGRLTSLWHLPSCCAGPLPESSGDERDTRKEWRSRSFSPWSIPLRPGSRSSKRATGGLQKPRWCTWAGTTGGLSLLEVGPGQRMAALRGLEPLAEDSSGDDALIDGLREFLTRLRAYRGDFRIRMRQGSAKASRCWQDQKFLFAFCYHRQLRYACLGCLGQSRLMRHRKARHVACCSDRLKTPTPRRKGIEIGSVLP